jgi:HEAT repeat protein
MRTGGHLILALALTSSTLALGQEQPANPAGDPPPVREEALRVAVDRLTGALESPDPRVRAEAALFLARIRGRLAYAGWNIARLLTDEDPHVRVAAADALLEFDDPSLQDDFRRAIANPDPLVQFRAAIGLHQMISHNRLPPSPEEFTGKIVVPPWYQDAVDGAGSPAVRGLLALACEQQSPDIPAAIPIAMKCLGSSHHGLVEAAVYLLSDRALGQPLIQCLTHNDADVRRGAARVLYGLETHKWDDMEENETLGPLTAALSDPDAQVRLYSLLSLMAFEGFQSERFVSMTEDADPMVRCGAVAALKKREPRGTVDVLSRLVSQDPSTRVRVRAAFALASVSLPEDVRDGKDGEVDSIIARLMPDPLVGIALAYRLEDWKTPPLVENVEPALAIIGSALEEEHRRPFPPSQGFDYDEPSDGFDVSLIGAAGAQGPAARSAVRWILKELRGMEDLGSGDYRTDPHGEKLSTVLYALDEIGPTPELIGALDDDHRVVRTVAAMALCGEGDLSAKTVPILVSSLDGECWGWCVFSHTRRADVSCLGGMGERSAPAMLQLVREGKHVRLAAEALGLMRYDASPVVPLITAVLDQKQEPAHVRAVLAEVLGEVGEEHAAAFELLRRMLLDAQEPELVRVGAAKGLGASRFDEVLGVLRKCESDDSAAVRAAVKGALSRAQNLVR